MNSIRKTALTTVFLLATLGSAALLAQERNDQQLLQARESVWRAFFADDTKALAELVPSETIALSRCRGHVKQRKFTYANRPGIPSETEACETVLVVPSTLPSIS